MNEFVEQALAYLKAHWHTGMTGTADAAQLLNINPNTFKTRLARGQAMVLRDPNGEQRAILTFTGYHLVYNLLSDRLLRYGFPVDHDERTLAELPHVYAEWAFNNILSPPHHSEAILRFRKEADGGSQNMAFEDGNVQDWTGDAALIIPLGTMIVRLAATLYMRTGHPRIPEQLRNA
jgi:hypothetical protein